MAGIPPVHDKLKNKGAKDRVYGGKSGEMGIDPSAHVPGFANEAERRRYENGYEEEEGPKSPNDKSWYPASAKKGDMAAAPVVSKLRIRKKPISGSGSVTYPKPHDPEPQAGPVKGTRWTGDQALPGAQPNNNDASGKNKDMGSADAKQPKRTPPKSPIPPYKRPSPGGNKEPIPNPKKRGGKNKLTGLATYASQIK